MKTNSPFFDPQEERRKKSFDCFERKKVREEEKKRKMSGPYFAFSLFLAYVIVQLIQWIILYIDVIQLFTRNQVIMGFFWVEFLAFLSIYVGDLEPRPPLWEIILGPIGFIKSQPVHMRAFFIFNYLSFALYAVSASQLDQEMLFRYPILASQMFLILAITVVRKYQNHVLSYVKPGHERQNSAIAHALIFFNGYVYWAMKTRHEWIRQSMGLSENERTLNRSEKKGISKKDLEYQSAPQEELKYFQYKINSMIKEKQKTDPQEAKKLQYSWNHIVESLSKEVQ